MKDKIIFINFMILIALFFGIWSISAYEIKDDVEQRVKTVYNSTGRPANQSQDAKGLHYVADNVQLSSGSVIVTLNSSTADGRQDISFISAFTYGGIAWNPDTSIDFTYRVIPLTGLRFKIQSSDNGDTSWVYYRVEGE